MKVRDPSLFSIHADMKFSSQIYHGNRPKPVPLRVDSRGVEQSSAVIPAVSNINFHSWNIRRTWIQ